MSRIELSMQFGGRVFESVEGGMQEIARMFEADWGGKAKVFGEVLSDYLYRVAEILTERNSKSWPGGTSGSSISSRTGQSVDSIIKSVKVKGTTWATMKGTIGGRGTLAIHEYGGTITSGAKLMTIPLPAALSSRGTSPPFARQWKNTFVARSKKGNLIIFQKRGAEIVPLYLLVSSVTLPPRLGMRKELGTQVPYFMARAADRVAQEFQKQLGS